MSRKKDRERVEAMRRLDPDYRGFRGHRSEPNKSKAAPLERATCSVCGRTRNVPRGIALEQGDTFVCATCREADTEPEPPKEGA